MSVSGGIKLHFFPVGSCLGGIVQSLVVNKLFSFDRESNQFLMAAMLVLPHIKPTLSF